MSKFGRLRKGIWRMRTSELILKLQENLKEFGDLPVDLWPDETDSQVELAGLSTAMGKNDQPIGLSLCGPETLEAFRET